MGFGLPPSNETTLAGSGGETSSGNPPWVRPGLLPVPREQPFRRRAKSGLCAHVCIYEWFCSHSPRYASSQRAGQLIEDGERARHLPGGLLFSPTRSLPPGNGPEWHPQSSGCMGWTNIWIGSGLPLGSGIWKQGRGDGQFYAPSAWSNLGDGCPTKPGV